MIDKLVNVFDQFMQGDRIQELSLLASDYKLSFYKRSPISAEVIEIRGFEVFGKKGTKRFVGIIGEPSNPFKGQIRFYDYLRTKDLETKTTSVIEVYCEDIYTDYIKIEPKGTFAKMKGFFTTENQQFPDIKSFYQAFQISSKEEGGARWLNKSALQSMEDYPGMTIEASGNHFLFYYRNKQMPVQNIISMMEFAEEFVRLTCFDRSQDFV